MKVHVRAPDATARVALSSSHLIPHRARATRQPLTTTENTKFTRPVSQNSIMENAAPEPRQSTRGEVERSRGVYMYVCIYRSNTRNEYIVYVKNEKVFG
jgi:hypothetical protein